MTTIDGSAGDRRLQRRTTSDAVADELRAAIVRGDFADGVELNQVELARAFGVSRVPIREAIRQLKAEGLVVTKPHMRAAVVGHTLARVLEVLEMRVLVECYLVGRCGERLTSEDLDELWSLCAQLRLTEEHDEWLVLNTGFHDRLYDVADAPVAQELAHQLTIRVQRYVRMARSGAPARPGDANREHEEILGALADGRLEAAQHALATHIQHTADQVRKIFESRDLP